MLPKILNPAKKLAGKRRSLTKTSFALQFKRNKWPVLKTLQIKADRENKTGVCS
jgi:hypothetical protein